MSMPDKWEYPWFAAWDMAFHCVALAHVDPAFAKYQLTLLGREWFQNPNGAIPAYEWAFDDVNPPVQAWAALQVYAIDGAKDIAFLNRIFDKLLINFTWWVNRKDADGSNVFEGGFLGLDNIGPIDRSHLQPGQTLQQSDATAWMAFYAVSMGAIALILNCHGRDTSDLVLKFVEHLLVISEAMSSQGMWDEEDGFYYDRLRQRDGSTVPIKVASMVGVLPLMAFAVIPESMVQRAKTLGKRTARLLERRHLDLDGLVQSNIIRGEPGQRKLLLGVVDEAHLLRILARLADEAAFLSPYGLRALSRAHLEHPYHLAIDGTDASIDYEPAESTTAMFGGNSNWRGPIWFPVNYLIVDALLRFARFYGDFGHDRVPGRIRAAGHAPDHGRGHPAEAHLRVPRRRRWPTALLRLDRQVPARSRVEGQPALPRVLPRRQRRRPGRLPPDRLDRHRRRSHPAQRRRGHPHPCRRRR